MRLNLFRRRARPKESGSKRKATAVEVANELGFEANVAQEQLAALVASELLAQSEGDESNYRYAPVDQKMATMVNQLAMAYSRQRVPILSLILTERPDRIRLFAEAFRLIRRND